MTLPSIAVVCVIVCYTTRICVASVSIQMCAGIRVCLRHCVLACTYELSVHALMRVHIRVHLFTQCWVQQYWPGRFEVEDFDLKQVLKWETHLCLKLILL